jgi:hypothetical protein
MKYLMITIDMLRMGAAIPLYLAAMLCAGCATIFEYAADMAAVPDAPIGRT